MRTLVRLKYSSGGLKSHCFDDAVDKPAIILPPNSSLRSSKNTDVLTSASEPQEHHVLAMSSARSKNFVVLSQFQDQEPFYSNCSRMVINELEVNFNFS